MELRITYGTKEFALKAMRACTAQPGDIVIWDAGTSSKPAPQAEMWPALLVSLTAMSFGAIDPLLHPNGVGPHPHKHAVIATVMSLGSSRVLRINARFVRRPKAPKPSSRRTQLTT